MSVTCFLPCRKGSERVPKKNFKPFAGFQNGLIEIKLSQLSQCAEIDQIVLSTNDDYIIDFANSLKIKKLKVHQRDDGLGQSETSNDDLIKHALDISKHNYILWTHVTAPFFSSSHYSRFIRKYFKSLKLGYDSIVSVNTIQGYIWNKYGPIAYDRKIEKWPRTQTIDPLYEINSAAFMNSKENYKLFKDRIGENPFLYETNNLVGFDIDWPEDFVLAEAMLTSRIVSI